MPALLVWMVTPAVVVLAVCAAGGPDSRPGPWGETTGSGEAKLPDCSDPACLTLTAPRTEPHLAEPVTLVVTLVNRSGRALDVMDPLAPEFGALTLWAQPPSQTEPTLYQPVVRRDGRGRPSRSLAPGESISNAFTVTLGREGWLLAQPGPHRLWAEYPLPDGTRLRSNDLTVEVLPPGSPRDQQAVEGLMAPEPSLFFQMKGGEHLEKGTRDLEALSRRYPDTYAAAYADLALGISESQSAFDPQTKSFREPDCEAAASRLARALPAIADPLTAARGTGVLVECLTRLGREDEARDAVRGFDEAHPEARTLPGVDATLDRALNQK